MDLVSKNFRAVMVPLKKGLSVRKKNIMTKIKTTKKMQITTRQILR